MSGLFGLGQSLLQALDPERAHDLAIKSLELGLYPRAEAPDDKRLAQTVFGLDFPNPVGMAAGFDKNARVPRAASRHGLRLRRGRHADAAARKAAIASPRIFRSRSRTAPSSTGSASTMRARRRRLPGCKTGRTGIVGINLGAGRDSDDRIADYVTGIERMAEVASYFTVNISSPNTPGLRDLQAPEALDALLKRVQAARQALPSKPAAAGQARARSRRRRPAGGGAASSSPHGVDGIIVSNTTLAREGLRDRRFRQGERRAVGAAAVRPRRRGCWRGSTGSREGKLPLIGVGGIDSGEAALAKIEAGASLLQLYTGLVFEGPGLIGRIKQALVDGDGERRMR